ncbi:DEAD/DEAH box helicase [Candidatus Dojkabacteria bacterium]|uniref:DEAD/DEAH box helicase n=1 Tax=Candidatus Dojkabacteria bacterium TaxID=2099670 RepID=A0A955L9K2_9BACT|nr:DEAD/DEAH box helicase [Candidatus Dojkabacteria bacterium]
MNIQNLFTTINLDPFKQESKSSRILYVTGMLSHLQKDFLSYIHTELGSSVLYSKRNNSDIQKYFSSIQEIRTGNDAFTLSGLEITLEENGFSKVPKVSSPTEWTKKGDVISFWPIGYEHPVRISYFGDDVEYMELFDEVYGTRVSLISSCLIGNCNRLEDKVDWYEISTSGTSDINSSLIIVFSQYSVPDEPLVLELDFNFPQLFYKRFDLLEKELLRLDNLGWNITIATGHSKELPDSLKGYVTQVDKSNAKYTAGFSSHEHKILYVTDRELFGTLFLQRERKRISTKQAQKVLEKLEGEIEIDDYVVHEDHGIGVYKGLQQNTRIEERMVNFERIREEIVQDFLTIEYAEGDQLLEPLANIQKITKYIGTTEDDPEITRLHKGHWKTAMRKTKKAIELIARDLVEHYAKLELQNIDAIPYEDSDFYQDFMESFPYEETPDQLTAIDDIKKDLAQNKPMNRLIVGDVGFGKTEVAMRAAFKVIETGKQVAVLCPTTVLAAQHYKVFKDRFGEFGIKVGYVSRFHTAKENKEMLDKASKGEYVILVGTHRLLSNDVEFKDLGLVIIDEEQKFGVKQKEKIRKLQYGSHSLAMSATPIPRTLSMALSQIQEISIIATPPTERRAVKTVVTKTDWEKIAFQLQTEIQRGGQAYFVHNKVQTIESIKLKLENLLPDIKFAVGHGQMKPKDLDTVISDFYNQKYDVLIATTIIENGIDMPNVNTIVINDAQNFGLGQLYQLRGRVGRSDKQAYCYLYYKGKNLKSEDDIQQPVKSRDIDDTEETQKKVTKELKYIERLKAIMDAQELGAGFKLASRDLEIRGAGNLLGKQQHGNITNVGLALYMQMLAEEIERLKVLSQYENKNEKDKS